MTLVEAVKTCLRKYIVFSGRASRAEFWKFVLGIFLVSIIASIANVMVFGPVIEAKFVVVTTSQGTTQGLQNTVKYGPGPFSTFIQLAVFLPFLAAANRRLHDIGRPGWHLALCWGVAILLVVITVLAFQVDVPVSEQVRTAVPSLGETVSVPQPPTALLFVSLISMFASLILSIVWLARRGRPEANQYGPALSSPRS
ncbi:DUF805 domain-containing protein [Actibacterium sp. XHP0104]|uniref:DUF805 domain-containing protein n=1 Tax=Actibacterium sp. XHP0104 TaxID=2984335 RepID=UPI0021E8D113|nr:DUF805 domain-containing protein [Actibacterium sp. XHP0104]MCV2882372.1 DUF805 domain-containing protein [Actibacterium sp. XHP0104]